MSLRRVCEHLPKPLEQQPENGLALALGPAPRLSVVMEDSAGGAAWPEPPPGRKWNWGG